MESEWRWENKVLEVKRLYGYAGQGHIDQDTAGPGLGLSGIASRGRCCQDLGRLCPPFNNI